MPSPVNRIPFVLAALIVVSLILPPADSAPSAKDKTDPLLKGIETAKDFVQRYQASEKEVGAVLHALEGTYVEPGSGGDPIRNPDALPTGKNLYAINPRLLPSKAAWNLAVKLVEALLAKKVGETGQYPKKVGFNLWSTETVRHHGITLAQMLYLLGVRPRLVRQGRGGRGRVDSRLGTPTTPD